MGQVVIVVGVEHREALETALWYLDKGDVVYAAVIAGGQVGALRDKYPQLTIQLLDPEHEEATDTWMRQIEREQGRLDILIAQAGLCGAAKLDGPIAQAGLCGVAESDGPIAQAGLVAAGQGSGNRHDYDEILRIMDYNVNSLRHVIDCAVPLLRRGGKKRIAVITSKESSIGGAKGTGQYAWHMSLAAINMMEKLYFNWLRPEGMTFRSYAAEGTGGMCAAEYIDGGLCYDEKEPYIHSDENRLVMRDRYLREVPW